MGLRCELKSGPNAVIGIAIVRNRRSGPGREHPHRQRSRKGIEHRPGSVFTRSKRATATVTKGTAYEVPEDAAYPPPA